MDLSICGLGNPEGSNKPSPSSTSTQLIRWKTGDVGQTSGADLQRKQGRKILPDQYFFSPRLHEMMESTPDITETTRTVMPFRCYTHRKVKDGRCLIKTKR